MVDKVLSLLPFDPDGTYIDATVGGGGHAFALLARLSPNGRLVGIDADAEALVQAAERLGRDPRVTLVHEKFSQLAAVMQRLNFSSCHGILADLGVSSYQIDEAGRGFSYLHDGPLDMRMNADDGETAAALIERLNEQELADLIYAYGEERLSRRIARQLKAAAREALPWSTGRLVQVIERVVPARHRIKSIARVFQALRIAVNRELDELEAFLPAAFTALSAGGRLLVISYHSLEDRRVKQFMAEMARECRCPPEVPVCTCGRQAGARLLARRAIVPDAAEIARNPRARSARLRALMKLTHGE